MAEARESPEGQALETDGPDFEALLLRAGFNFHVFLAGAFAFSKARGASPSEFVAWLADRLAPTWSGLSGHGADAVLNLILENLASTGYRVDDVHYGMDESLAVVHAVPLGLERDQWQQLLEPFGLTLDDMRTLFSVFTPLARAAEASLDVAGIRDTVRLTVRRDPAVPPASPRAEDGETDGPA